MTLDRLRPLANRVLAPFVTVSLSLGVTPNWISVLAIIVAAAAALSFALADAALVLYPVGGLLVFLNGWLDLLDGALARELGTESPAGDLIDHVLDRYADILIIVGLAVGVDRYALGIAAVTGVLMTSYLGTQAQAVGLDRVYGGLLGRADRLALVGVVSVVTVAVPDPIRGLTLVGWLLVVFAVVGHATALQRFYHALRGLE